MNPRLAPPDSPGLPEVAHGELLRFERVLAELSTGFINRAAGDVDPAIDEALRRIAGVLEVERITLLRVGTDGVLFVTHSASVDGIAPVRTNLVPQYPWTLEEIKAGRPVAFTRVDDLPAIAVVDRANWTRIAVASNVTVPIFVGDVFQGALAIATFRHHRHWSAELVERVRMLATMLGNALEHKRTQVELATAVEFERLMSHTLAALVAAPQGAFDTVIGGALREGGAILGADRVTLWQREGTSAQFRKTHRHVAPGMPTPPNVTNMERLPWMLGEILANRSVSAPLSAFPPAAAGDVALLRELGAESIVAVPIAIDGHVMGALSFASASESRGWPESLVPRVRLFGEMLASLLARERAARGERDARAEAAHAARLGTMGVVAASLAHELTQPLAAIMTNAEMALHLVAAPEVDHVELRATLEDILADDRRAGKLIHQLRRFLRRDELERTALDVRALQDEVLSLVRGEVVGKGVSLSSSCAPVLPEVIGNHAQVQQVLLNLLLNAFDAVASRPPASRRVNVGVHAEGDAVHIVVEDAGVGMDAAAQERAFAPFYTTKAKGMGLGLSISRTIAEAHGGALTASSIPGEGSVFRFTLPAGPAAPPRS